MNDSNKNKGDIQSIFNTNYVLVFTEDTAPDHQGLLIEEPLLEQYTPDSTYYDIRGLPEIGTNHLVNHSEEKEQTTRRWFYPSSNPDNNIELMDLLLLFPVLPHVIWKMGVLENSVDIGLYMAEIQHCDGCRLLLPVFNRTHFAYGDSLLCDLCGTDDSNPDIHLYSKIYVEKQYENSKVVTIHSVSIKKADEESIPSLKVSKVLSGYPEAIQMSRMLRMQRNSDRSPADNAIPESYFKWPDWTYIPSNAWVQIAVEHTQETTFNNATLLSTLVCWRMNREIYTFDSQKYKELMRRGTDLSMTSTLLFSLPRWAIYIETPNFDVGPPDQENLVDGVFATIWFDPEKNANYLIMTMVFNANELFLPLSIEIGEWTVSEGLDRGMPYQDPFFEHLAHHIKGPLALIVYICSNSIYSYE